ncbi:MAG TPA: metallophosphoesterase [Bryobacteraceae bacterium]|nr:metallophosphoesterase [Bryobacteraceae bacterium]
MHHLTDFVSLAALLVVQWCIWREALAVASRRLSRKGGRVTRVLLLAIYAGLGLGLLLNLAHMAGKVRMSARLASVSGGVVYGWLGVSAASYGLWKIFQFLSRRIAPPSFDPARRQLMHAAGGALVASPFLVVGYGALVQRTDFHVLERDIAIPGLPKDLAGLRLLQISDIHLSAFLSESEFARVIDAANQTRCHLALVTGDLISSAGDPLDACLRQLARLRVDGGIFGCMGNHERYARVEEYAAEHGARLGIRFLRQEAAALRFGGSILNLAGVDYQRSSHRREYLQGAERLLAPGALNVLLSHNPDVFPVAARKGYNLMLSGHTHGGQVTVEILDQSINPARFWTPFVYGPYAEGAARAYVTRGIGTIGIPVRLGAPPEITVLRLRKA